jgi:hypothetical protein
MDKVVMSGIFLFYLNTSEIVMENYFMSRYLEGENMICKGKYM